MYIRSFLRRLFRVAPLIYFFGVNQDQLSVDPKEQTIGNASSDDVKLLETSAPFSDFAPRDEAEYFNQWTNTQDYLPRRSATAEERLCVHSIYSEIRILRLMDYFPEKFEGGGSLHNIGRRDDVHYIWSNVKNIQNGSVIGVLPRDMPRFISDIFPNIPKSAQITIINTHDDWSNPIEIFTGGIRKRRPGFMEVAWGTSKVNRRERLQKLSAFIEDERLKHWYIQNYDLLGCSFWTDSELYRGFNSSHPVFTKVSPLPIGSGFYSLGCRKGQGDDKVLRQLGAFVPWSQRNIKILGGGMKISSQKLSRQAMDNIVAEINNGVVFKRTREEGDSDIPGMNKNVKRYMTSVASVQFAIAPQGNGLDTHRIWEVLALGTVPIVMTSSLDLLYSNFPIVIINHPSELKAAKFVTKWTKRLTKRWGPEPISIEVRKRLRAMWWNDKVRSGTPVASSRSVEAFVASVEERSKAWPLCSIKQCKPKNLNDTSKRVACETEVLKNNFP